MTPGRWQRAKQLFQSAADRNPSERDAFLGAACGNDEPLRREVERMLRHGFGEGLLDRPAWDGAALDSGLAAGTQLGPYQIVGEIGAGGMGRVYQARDTRLGRTVAIKISSAEFSHRFQNEARAISALNHPHVCALHDIGEQDGIGYLVMEYVEGESLAARLSQGPLPFVDVLRYGMEIADALAAAHALQIVHRDLKPANIMITRSGVKVLDFGLAETASERALDAPEIGRALIGTLTYMSPEQLEGKSTDARSDIFALGLVLYEMVAGRRAFTGEQRTELVAELSRVHPPSLAGVPTGLSSLVGRCLQPNAAGRVQHMDEVRHALEALHQEAFHREALRKSGTAHLDPHAPARIPLIGREKEFAELQRLLDEALDGRGSLIMVGGEPGIGKTHLTGAILQEAEARNALAAIGHCYEMEGAPPYVPFIEMLEYSARMAPRESLRDLLGDDAPEVAKLMPELRAMYPDIPAAIQLPPEQQRRFLFNAYRSFIERSARLKPIVAVFEDLHWADEPTLLLLQHLAGIVATTPLLLIGTYRDVELDVTRPFAKTLETLVRQKRAARMSLRRLAVDGVEAMLSAMSGQTPPPSMARVVFEETEGNPYFVEEVFRHLTEEGKLFDETGKWRPGLRVDQLQVPEGVRLVLGRRLSRLGGDARRVLTTAAVIGRSFSLRLLEELEHQQPDAALDAVEEAERSHLVVAEAAGRETRYRFVHELVRQTLAGTLSLPRRQRLHARVADAVERVYSANLEAQASSLAHHLYQAGAAADPGKATSYLVLAARNARAGAAHEEALAHVENALSIWEGEANVRVGELMEQKAATLLSLGRTSEAVESYQKSIALFEAAGAVTRVAETSMSLALLHTWRFELADANRAIERGLREQSGMDLHLQSSLLSQRGGIMSSRGAVATAGRIFADVRALQHTLEGQHLKGFADLAETHYYMNSMQWETAMTAARRVAAAYRAAGDPWGEAEANWLRFYELFLGRPSEVAGLVEDAVMGAERIGHQFAVHLWKCTSAWLSLARGNLPLAWQEAEEAWKFGETHRITWAFTDAGLLGQIAFLRGDLVEAERWFARGWDVERGSYWSGWLESCRFAAWAEGNDARAWEAWTARRWNPPVAGQLNPAGTWAALERSVIGLAWLGKKEEAAALRPLAEELVRTGVCAYSYLSPLRTACGIAAACAGDWSAAEQHHLAAIGQTGAAPYRVSQPVSREWYATMLLERNASGDQTKARDLLRESLAMYESMGMPFHTRRICGKLSSDGPRA